MWAAVIAETIEKIRQSTMKAMKDPAVRKKLVAMHEPQMHTAESRVRLLILAQAAKRYFSCTFMPIRQTHNLTVVRTCMAVSQSIQSTPSPKSASPCCLPQQVRHTYSQLAPF